MARPPRLHPGRKSQRSAWRTLLPVVGCIVTFYVIWSVYSNPTMRSRDSKSNPVETVDERAQSATDEQRTCYPETDADYYGEEALHHEVVADMDACCALCQSKDKCNAYVYCYLETGCGDQPRGTCWLKNAHTLDAARPAGSRRPNLGWSSAAVVTPSARAAAEKAHADAARAEESRLAALRANESLPLVYLDVSIAGKPAGRIEAVLFPDVAPRAAENYRQLCTGEKGVVPEGREGAGQAYHFKGARFYRIIDEFIDQAGVNVESVFGGQFKDDAGGLKLVHDRKGLLSMANMGPNTNTAHFSIMMGPAHHLDGHYTIFGQVVAGFEVVDAINALAKGQPDNTANEAAGVVIDDAGQLRKGTIVPNLEL